MTYVQILILSPGREGDRGGTAWDRSTAQNVWALDFRQERFHHMGPGDFESTFIKAGASETKEMFRIEEARSQPQE